MSGVVSKKHFFLILWYFGCRKAIKLLLGRSQVALGLLMK